MFRRGGRWELSLSRLHSQGHARKKGSTRWDLNSRPLCCRRLLSAPRSNHLPSFFGAFIHVSLAERSDASCDVVGLAGGSKRDSSTGTNEPVEPRDLAGACSGCKFVVSRAGKAYDARARGPKWKFRVQTQLFSKSKRKPRIK